MFSILWAAEGTPRELLEAVAREFSPRIEWYGPREIGLDAGGLTRLFGDARTMGAELRRTAADRGLRVRVAMAATRTAARLMVRDRAGVSVIEPGMEAAALAPLSLSVLRAMIENDASVSIRSNVSNISNASNAPNASNVSNALCRWGIRTLGDLSALPDDEVAARLGQEGVAWQRRARGEDPRPLVPTLPEERFEQAFDLEWPIDGLEPLSFVLGRVLEPLSAHLERRGRGAAVLHVRLHLVTREVHARSIRLPAPMREARALRTLALLDLESHPPPAAIDRVVVAVEPAPGPVVQFSLLTRALPSPEQLSTLLARLAALMGEGRCGSPAPVDTWEPGMFTMAPFAPPDDDRCEGARVRRCEGARVRRCEGARVAIRRFRMPIAARVSVEGGQPVRLTIDRRGFGGGAIAVAAGPWRTSGAWWRDQETRSRPWDRDEWDVAVAGGATYRLFHERDTDRWFVEGVVD